MSARALGSFVVQEAEVALRASGEDVVPATDVIDGHFDLVAEDGNVFGKLKLGIGQTGTTARESGPRPLVP